jgi:hypothetical protein
VQVVRGRGRQCLRFRGRSRRSRSRSLRSRLLLLRVGVTLLLLLCLKGRVGERNDNVKNVVELVWWGVKIDFSVRCKAEYALRTPGFSTGALRWRHEPPFLSPCDRRRPFDDCTTSVFTFILYASRAHASQLLLRSSYTSKDVQVVRNKAKPPSLSYLLRYQNMIGRFYPCA